MITDEQAQREMAWAIERAVFEAVEMERARAIAIVYSNTNLYSAAIADQVADCIRNCQIQLTQEVICYVSEKVHRRFGSQAPPSYPRGKTSGAGASEASTARSERSEPGASSPAIPRSEMFCEHANESPTTCPCSSDCICRERPHCSRTDVLGDRTAACLVGDTRLDARLDRLVEVVEMLIKQDRMRYTIYHLLEKLKAV